MTKYDFTTLPNRLTHHTYKWKETETDPEIIPAWIADMDFNVIPEVREAVIGYADQMVYGYTYASDSLYQSILDWEKKSMAIPLTRKPVVFIEGVVPAISTAIQAFTKEGDAVLINTPVYPPFARSVKLNRRKLIENSLVEKDGLFQIDFDQLEKDIVEQEVKLYVLCNPHNPGGRVWDCEVLEKSDTFVKNMVSFSFQMRSTKIWPCLATVIPVFNTVDPSFKDFSLILTSATKTFNIAGTKNSYVVIENPKLRTAFKQRQLANNQHEISGLGYIATEAAYRHGKPWLTELKQVFEKHIDYVVDELHENTKIRVMKPQGTYLLWLDFSAYPYSDDELHAKNP